MGHSGDPAGRGGGGAIAAGVILNVSGLRDPIAANPVGAAVLQTLTWVAATIVPIILIVVGYGTRLDRAGFRQAAPLVAVRFVVVLTLALLVNWLLPRERFTRFLEAAHLRRKGR